MLPPLAGLYGSKRPGAFATTVWEMWVKHNPQREGAGG